MSKATTVKVSIDGSLATIVFSAENGINVMSSAVLEELADAVTDISAANQVRMTVLRAEGKVFIAGADIKEMKSFGAPEAKRFSSRGNEVMDSLAALPSITVAAMHGAALGGGCEIVLACDFRIATEKVQIGLPETSLGLIPGWGGTQRALTLLGPSWARRLIWSATPLAAAEAAKIGLVDQVVSDEARLSEAVQAMNKQFQRGGPKAITMAKRAFLTGNEPAAFAECFAGDESAEGMAAFVEKRKAKWMEA